MKQISLSLLLIVNLCSISYAKDSVKEIFPKSEKVWAKEYEGELKDIAVVEESGDIIFLTQDQDIFHLYYLDDHGEQLWKVTNTEKNWRKLYGLSISKNGEIIVVRASNSWEETAQNWVYDNKGFLLFEDTASFGSYHPSPSGKYLTYQQSGNYYPLVIYNRDGSKLEIEIPWQLQVERQKHRFISENEILVYQEILENKRFQKAQLLLVTILDMQIKWNYELDTRLWLIDFHQRNCAVSADYIALQGTARPGNIYLFSREDGRLFWESSRPQSNHGLAFINHGRQLVSLARGKNLYLFDAEDGRIIDQHQLFDWGGIDGVPKISYANNELVIFSNSIGVKDEDLFGTDKQVTGMYSTIIGMDEEKKIKETSFIPYPVRLSVSPKDSMPYLIGKPNKDEKQLIKMKIHEDE